MSFFMRILWAETLSTIIMDQDDDGRAEVGIGYNLPGNLVDSQLGRKLVIDKFSDKFALYLFLGC